MKQETMSFDSIKFTVFVDEKRQHVAALTKIWKTNLERER